MAKPCIGFPTQQEAKAAIQKIVWKYEPHREFFDPLVQKLFLERPYWCDPPGPCFTKFRWSSKALPNGAMNDRYFMGFSNETGWVGVSFNKAIVGKRTDVRRILTDFTRERVMSLTTSYRIRHPWCEHCCPGMLPAADAHHTIPLVDIISEAMAPLTAAQHLEIMDGYLTWRGIQSFTLPDDHPYTAAVLAYHQIPGILVALCKMHHNTAHGKQTHVGKGSQESGQEAP